MTFSFVSFGFPIISDMIDAIVNNASIDAVSIRTNLLAGSETLVNLNKTIRLGTLNNDLVGQSESQEISNATNDARTTSNHLIGESRSPKSLEPLIDVMKMSSRLRQGSKKSDILNIEPRNSVKGVFNIFLFSSRRP